MSEVVYRDCPGLPGYRVGDDGSVWSCWSAGGRYKKSTMTNQWHRLNPTAKPCGHLHVMTKGGKLKLVHTLVLTAFVGPRPQGMECRHFPDRDPSNNRLENLSWGTRQQNVDDQIPHGTKRKGTMIASAKLSDDAVREIRTAAAQDSSRGYQSRLARKYHVDQSIISEVISRKRWKHVE